MNELYQSLVAVEPFTLIVTILNLFLQLYLLKRFFLDKVLRVLDQRRSAADRQMEQAENAKQEALTMKQTYEENLHQTRQMTEQILEEAQKTAIDRSAQIVYQAQEQAAKLKQKAVGEIAQEKKKARNEAKDEIADMAMNIAEKVVGRVLTPKEHSRLVDEFIQQLGEGT